jgi:hypothetical protein
MFKLLSRNRQNKIAVAGMDLHWNGWGYDGEANHDARHFYSTLIDFNLRVGISPLYTLVLPMISKKSPA